MDKKIILAVLVLGVIIALSLALFFDLGRSSSKEEIIGGARFVSDSVKPSDHLSLLSRRSVFVVSPEFTVGSGKANSFMADIIVRSNIILAFENKQSVVVARTVDAAGELLSCYTNEGDYREGKEIDVNECISVLSNPDNAVIKVSLPTGEKESVVNVSGNVVGVFPSSEEDVSSLSHLVLRLIFGDGVDEAIELANKKSSELGG